MMIEIDLASARSLYHQIADGVRRALIEGNLKPGDRLPPGRELAVSLGVNLETVQRAYRQLADDGLVTSRVGRGTRVADSIDFDHLGIQDSIDALISKAAELGISGSDVLALVSERLSLDS